jgi:hypothetical protein
VLIAPEEYRQKLLAAFPKECLKAFLLGVGDAYRETPEHCKRHFEKEDRHDLVGRVRRAKVHESLRGVAERFNLEHKDVPNSNGSTYFLCVLSGEIRLITCLIPTRRSMVRPAKIRKLWARNNVGSQHTFWLSEEADEQKLRLEHLAILVHAPYGRHKDEVSFVDIVIPSQNFKDYEQRLDLFALFPKEGEEYRALFRKRREKGFGKGA